MLFMNFSLNFKNTFRPTKIADGLGVVHKLSLQDELGGLKMSTFVNVHTIENVNAGGRWSKNIKILST